MKKQYLKPETEIIQLSKEEIRTDIIAASGTSNDGTSWDIFIR